MANAEDPSTTPEPFRLRWDVFISFRGEDTRQIFTKDLHSNLCSHGIRAFLDDEGLNRGEDIAPSLIEAIEDSAASIAIISPDYASSRWCLEELVRICEVGRLIFPVFYHVDPSDVRHQRGTFQEAFEQHKLKYGEKQILKWRNALQKVANLAGWVYTGHGESEKLDLIQMLVKEVLKQISNTPLNVARHAVGLESRVEDVMKMLNVKSNHVEVIGLHGMGGIGKTTLAKALYNKLLGYNFEFRSFISDVRGLSADPDGLVTLQSKLIADLSGVSVQNLNTVDVNSQTIRRIVEEKKVLVVLDDVDDMSQLKALGAEIECYASGSRIIITTRDKVVLHERYVTKIYEVNELDREQALELFSYHAFRREKPTEDFLSLSEQIVSLTGKLPLALEVFGSYLFDKRTKTEWEDALKKLSCIRPHNLQDVLKISFDGLDTQEKCIFLDIACFFVKLEIKREDAIYILRGCGFNPDTAITDLTRKSLIKISADDTFWMHDQLRDMGRQIVREENLTDPGMRSRLWDHEEIMTVLENYKGTRSIQGIILNFKRKLYEEPSPVKFARKSRFNCLKYARRQANKELMVLHTKHFKRMVSLRLLHINHVKLKGKFKYLPAELKWLHWRGCPFKVLPSDFCPQKLAVLNLSESKINNLSVAQNLLSVNLRGCYNLAAIPDLSKQRALERLVLERCQKLTYIHDSVGSLSSLHHLNMRDCLNLEKLPGDVSGLKSLETLILSGCSKLKGLPDDIGSITSLKELSVDNTAIEELPESVYRLTKLEKLSLTGCRSLEQLPRHIGGLSSLKELLLSHSALKELPESTGSLRNLETLSLLKCESLTKIPDTIGNLKLLVNLLISGKKIKELPASMGMLPYLKDLWIGKCQVEKLPVSIGGLVNVVELELDGTPITYLPDQIGELKSLQKLVIRECPLSCLPESIGNLLALTTLNIFKVNITELPESIGRLESLVMLRLNQCKILSKLPASIGNLKSLHHLWMEKTAVTELPESFGMLSNLMVFKMSKMQHGSKGPEQDAVTTLGKPVSDVLQSSFSSLSSLEELDARAWRMSGKIPDDFEKLSALEILDLRSNNISHLSSSFRGLSNLKKLLLADCNELEHLPPLPSSLEELNLCNCVALEKISDLSNLTRLQELNLANCVKIQDLPGFESLESLKRLFMTDCHACSSAVKRRFSKACMKNMNYLSMPGSRIPDWFCQDQITFSIPRNREIKAMIIAVIVSIDHHIQDDLRDHLPSITDIQAQFLQGEIVKVKSTLNLKGVPMTDADTLYLCRYPAGHQLVLTLENGSTIQVMKRNPPSCQGVELKKAGIHLVFNNDDDYEGNEESLNESQQSLSEKLAKFFRYPDDENGVRNHGSCKQF